jgi:hypothetical protein
MAVIKKLIIKTNDLQPYYYAQVKDAAGAVVDITGVTIVATMRTFDGTVKINRQSTGITISDAANGKFQYEWQSGETDTAGKYYIEFEISPSAGGKFTVPADNGAVVEIVDDLDAS